MNAITITKNLTKGEELVIIPRKEYEEFLRLRKIIPVMKMTPFQKRDLEQARKDYKKERYITLEQLEHELGVTDKK